MQSVGFGESSYHTQYIMDFDAELITFLLLLGQYLPLICWTVVIYVNGVVNGTLTANAWNFVEVTTTTAFATTSSMTFVKLQLHII